jgi:hypothetical protein
MNKKLIGGTAAALAAAAVTTTLWHSPDAVNGIFANGFDPPAACPVQRQMRGEVFFGVAPAVRFYQPLEKWGDLWGFGWTCPRVGGTCVDVASFPQILGAQPVLKAETAKYVALPFTTAGVGAMTAGAFKPSPSAGTPGLLLRMTISPQCGDFDSNSAWLSTHPKCTQDVAIEQTFKWTTAPSANVCSFNEGGTVDPNKTWYINMKTIRCNDKTGPQMPAICDLNILHQ